MSGKETTWSAGASRLRILASLAIVALHTMNVSEILYRDRISEKADWLSLLIVYLLMWAVPVFVMVSGALLLDPEREIGIPKIFGRYVLRVFLALLLFVLLYRTFDGLMDPEKDAGPAAIFSDGFRLLFTGGSWSHLWYLYLLIGLYLLLPAYRAVAKHCEKPVFVYLMAVGFVFLSLLTLTGIWDVTSAFHIQIPAVYTLYFFLGYGIASEKFKLGRGAGFLLFLAGVLLTVFLSAAQFATKNKGMTEILSSYSSPAVVLQSAGLFALLWPSKAKEKEGKFLRSLDATTFGIYLVHLILLRLVLRYAGFDPYAAGAWSFAVLIVLCFAASALITAILRLIPGMKRIL
ncbi:MAG: acyltransferase family protein [Lachnospiraceae bacterium]|nr:acyltransferase family protein [Lachnospiraceae bacterium]